MKFLHSTSICILLAAPVASGQNLIINGGLENLHKFDGPTTPEEFHHQVIDHILNSPEPIGSVQLGRMGDRAAVYINELLQGRPPLSPSQQYRVVDMLHRAFELPAAISQPGRQTTATISLLESIRAQTLDFGLKLRISDANDFVSAIAFIQK